MNGEVIPGFEIYEKISEGPAFISHKARQTALDRLVVLTLMSPEFAADEEWSRRVLKEAKKVARLKQPGILQVFDLGQEADRLFLVTEYVEGATVSQLLKSIGRLPFLKARGIVRDVAEALEFAWVRASLLHGGLTPGRIIIEQNQAKVAGLGLAGLDAEQRGLEEISHYLPPDRTPGSRPTARDDIYALGIIWREMLTGLPTVPEEARGASPTSGNPPPGVPAADWKVVRRMTAASAGEDCAKWTDVIRELKALPESEAAAAPAVAAPVIRESPRPAPVRRVVVAPSPATGEPVSAPSVSAAPVSRPAIPSAVVGGLWAVVVLAWMGAAVWGWRLPGGSGGDLAMRDLPPPGAPAEVPKTQGYAPSTPVAPPREVVPPDAAKPVNRTPTADERRRLTERAITDMEDQAAAYLLREEYENAVAALDIILEDSEDDEVRRAARTFKEFVAQVADLPGAVASVLRLKSGEDLTVRYRGKPVTGRLMSASGGQIELEETLDQNGTIIKRRHSIAMTEVDALDRARWLGDGTSPARKAMLFVLAWRSRQPETVLSQLAAQSGALSGAFQRRMESMASARSGPP